MRSTFRAALAAAFFVGIWLTFQFPGGLPVIKPASAAITATPALPQTPRLGTVQFLQGTDTAGTYKTVYAGSAAGPGSKITGIFVTTNDPSASHLVTIQLSTSSSAHCSPATSCFGGAAVTIPVNSGFANGAPAVNMMSVANWPGLPYDSDGNPYFYLTTSTVTVEATFATALTSGAWLNIVAVGADF